MRRPTRQKTKTKDIDKRQRQRQRQKTKDKRQKKKKTKDKRQRLRVRIAHKKEEAGMHLLPMMNHAFKSVQVSGAVLREGKLRGLLSESEDKSVAYKRRFQHVFDLVI